MDEKSLLKLSLIVSLLGLTALYFIAINSTLPDFQSEKVKSLIGKDIYVVGTIKQISDSEKLVKMVIRDDRYGNEVPLVVFKSPQKIISLNVGNEISVIGEVRQFQGKYEVIVYEIKIIK